MISQSSVLMATPIALLATERGKDLNENASDVIKGLNATTASINGFTEDNIAVELPDYTRLVDEHTFFMDEATTIIAERIRAALSTISKTVKPILKDVEARIINKLDPSNVVESIFSYVNVEMVNIEPSFLNSRFYPGEIPANFEGIPSVRLDQLLSGTWPQLSAEELTELVYVDVPEVRTFLNNPTEIKEVYDTLFLRKNWYDIFDGNSISDGVANIGNHDNYKFTSFRKLVIGSMLLNKLVANDDPLEGVTGVSLSDYRASLRVTRDLFNTLLFIFKQVWEQRAAAGVVIISDGVKVVTTDYGNLQGKPVLQGKLVIGYNNAVLEMFASSGELSLSEYAVGYVYAKYREYQVKDIITDRETVLEAWVEYCSDMRTALILRKTAIAVQVFNQVMETLYTKEEYQPFIDTIDEHLYPSQRILQRVQSRIQPEAFFANTNLLDEVVRGENTLMNTPLAAVLAGAFDCPIAEEILTINASVPAGSLEQQRKQLSSAITGIILDRLLPSV